MLSKLILAAFTIGLILSGAAAMAETPAAPKTTPMMARPFSLPIPYEICMNYCANAKESMPFRQCHDVCKELVPLPPTLEKK